MTWRLAPTRSSSPTFHPTRLRSECPRESFRARIHPTSGPPRSPMESIEIPGPLGRRPRRLRAARVRQFAAVWVLVEEAVRRLIDFCAALALLLTLSPLLLIRAVY